MTQRLINQRKNAGQALIELAVALIAVLVLTAALIQLGTLSRVHLDVQDSARERAGRRSLGEWYGADAPPPIYLRDWSEGPDRRPYTRDDVPLRGNPETVRHNILRHGRPNVLRLHRPGNPFSEAMANDPLVARYGLVGAREESPPIPLLPIIRRLVYQADAITLEATVWSVRLDGLE